MKILQRHKETLTNYNKDPNYKLYGGYFYFNEDHKEILFENVFKTEFKHMYSTLIRLFHEENLIKIDDGIYNRLKYLLDNKEELKKSIDNRIFVNSLYGKLHNLNGNNIIHMLISNYTHLLYNELLESYPNNILYIDTDCIFHTEEINLDIFPLEYEANMQSYTYFIRKKSYLSYDKDGLSIKGSLKRTNDKVNEVINTIKGNIRNRQLENIGI